MAIFKKLFVGDTVASSGTKVFKKLTTDEPGLPIWNGTDLNGTRWKTKSGWSADAGYGKFEIKGSRLAQLGSGTAWFGFNYFYIGYVTPLNGDITASANTISFAPYYTTDTTEEIIFGLGEGTDATNPRLIDWLIKNGELISHQPAHKGGLYDAGDNLVASWDALVNTYGMTLAYNPLVDPINTKGSACYTFTNNSELASGTKIVIPATMKNIPNGAFEDCTNLTSVAITDGTTSIGIGAFKGCTSLTSVIIPDSVTNIGNSSFKGCTNLTSVIIPGSVTYIGMNAFGDCVGLTSVTISEGVERIDMEAFRNCDSLTSVTIPGSVATIYPRVFAACENLATVTIGAGVETIYHEAFIVCPNLNSIYIPNSVTSIGSSAFYKCTSLTNVYYQGTEQEWAAITIDAENDPLINATIHYNYTG